MDAGSVYLFALCLLELVKVRRSGGGFALEAQHTGGDESGALSAC